MSLLDRWYKAIMLLAMLVEVLILCIIVYQGHVLIEQGRVLIEFARQGVK